MFDEELAYVAERRTAAGVDREGDPRRDLVGLAFSGGGIRSATFNLGIVQSLARRGVMDHVDYLSTVGGGGFLGGLLSQALRDGGAFPFDRAADGRESPFLTWLRNKSGHLGGATFRLWVARLSGFLRNLFVLVPWLMVLAVGVVAVTLTYAGWWPGLASLGTWPYRLTVLGAVLVAMLWLWTSSTVKLARRLRKKQWSDLGSPVRGLLVVVTGVVVAVAVVESIILLRGPLSLALAWAPYPSLLLLGLAGLAAVVSIVAALAELGGRLGTIARWTAPVGFVGLSLGGVIWLADVILIRLAERSPRAWELLQGAPSSRDLAPLARALAWDPSVPLQLSFWLAAAVFLWLLADLVNDGNRATVLNRFRDRLRETYLVGFARSASSEGGQPDAPGALSDLRPVSCRLSDLGRRKRAARSPYHLLNASIDLEGSRDPSVQERGADYFTFSPFHFGGPRTGYAATEALEAVSPRFDLATAMAISASAASPNVGRGSSGSELAAGALINALRPGFWIPNPGHLAKGRPWTGIVARLRWRPRQWLLFKELFGRFDESDRWINVGTGEPLDSLGVYELLRRRCRFIVVGDAELDPEMTFSGLATVIRRARVDLGVQIDLKLDPVRPDVDGKSASHHAFGSIRYPALDKGEEAFEGVLLYIKSSLTGDEGTEIDEYRARSPEFPHEDTARQVFGEGQFDAYRDLALHATEGILADLDRESLDAEALAAWFEAQLARPEPEEPTTPIRPQDEQRKRRQERELAEEFEAGGSTDEALGRKLVKLRRQLGMNEEAIKVYDLLLHAQPKNADLLEEKARLHRSLGDELLYHKTFQQATAIREHDAAQQNLGAEIGISEFSMTDLDFFGDFEWSLNSRINVLLGKNGYGKSHLLRAVVGMLQNDEEVTAEFLKGSGKRARMEVSIERDGRFESSVRTRVTFDERFGRVPVLAIPDVRFVDRSRSAFSPPAEPPAELSSDGATLFLEQRSYEERIGTFFYQLAWDYSKKGPEDPIFELLESSARRLTDSSFEFDSCTVKDARVTFWVRTDGNEDTPLPLQKASQGTLSILTIIGLIYRYLASVYEKADIQPGKLREQRAIVVVDEIDAHLHPSWQQKIVQLLRDKFPNVQFILTAHSPLVVAGCRDGEVSVLRRPSAADEGSRRDGFFVDPVDGHFIGATSGEVYRKIFEVEDKDETYRRLTTQFAKRDELREKLARFEAKIEKQESEGQNPAPEDVEEMERLADQLYYLREFEEARSERERETDLATMNRKLEADRLRLQAELESARRAQDDLEEAVNTLASTLPIDFLRASLERDPDAAPKLEPLIEWLGERELVEEASSLLAVLTKADPENLDYLERLAVFYEKHGCYEDALKLWQRAAQAAPDDKRDQYRAAAENVRQLGG